MLKKLKRKVSRKLYLLKCRFQCFLIQLSANALHFLTQHHIFIKEINEGGEHFLDHTSPTILRPTLKVGNCSFQVEYVIHLVRRENYQAIADLKGKVLKVITDSPFQFLRVDAHLVLLAADVYSAYSDEVISIVQPMKEPVMRIAAIKKKKVQMYDEGSVTPLEGKFFTIDFHKYRFRTGFSVHKAVESEGSRIMPEDIERCEGHLRNELCSPKLKDFSLQVVEELSQIFKDDV